MKNQQIALIIGGGIAGISCAYELVKKSDIRPIIIEAGDVLGGLTRTLNYDGNLTDIGPHRFFSKDSDVLNFWEGILPLQGKKAKDDIILNREMDFKNGTADPETEDKVFLKRRRFSRIFI